MKNYIDAILLGICENLQLSTSLYDMANKRYNTIADILQNDAIFKDIDIKIYPHGSFRLKTTVKPLKNNEFDLDFVAELPKNSIMNPKELYDHIFQILRHDGIHNEKVELKSRCIRVNYANDFHMDIMPAKLINEATSEIIVPDKELSGWYHHSNPKGFADWFENQARNSFMKEMSRTAYSKFDVESISEQEMAAKLEPLRRAVQLVKRYRDIYCDKHKTEPVRSIILCTLMGKITNFAGDTLQIISSFCFYVINLIKENSCKPFDVFNPVVDEILTEKWHEGNNYGDFVSMMKSLSNDVSRLMRCTNNQDANRLTKEMFGETITNLAITNYAKKINASRKSGELSVDSSGTLNTLGNGVSIKKNTFYGDDKA